MDINALATVEKSDVVAMPQIHCDDCGELIESIDQGRVEWLVPKNSDTRSAHLHVVHLPPADSLDMGCMYDKALVQRNGYRLVWYPLRAVLGSRGLCFLVDLHQDHLLSDVDFRHLVRRFHRGGR